MTTGGSCTGTTMGCVDGDDDVKEGSGGLTIIDMVTDVFGGTVEDVATYKISI